MLQASELMTRAEECVRMARVARTPQQRTMLLHIAETWIRLAEDVAENPMQVRTAKRAARPKN